MNSRQRNVLKDGKVSKDLKKIRPIFVVTKMVIILSCIIFSLSIGHNAYAKDPENIKVKGLYLGMDFAEAKKVLKNNIPESLKSHTRFEEPFPDTVWLMTNVLPIASIEADPGTKKLISYDFQRSFADMLFNTQGMTAQNFAKHFISAYKIGTMSPFRDGNIVGWQFVSNHGYVVQITHNGELIVKKISTGKELNFN